MKTKFSFLALLMLLSQFSWSQCGAEVNLTSDTNNGTVTETYEMIFTWQDVNFNFTDYGYNSSSAQIIPVTATSPACCEDTLSFTIEYLEGEPHPAEGDTLFLHVNNDSCSVEEIFLLGNNVGGPPPSTDPRQIGQLIENLGNGELVTLSPEGDLLAFSSANGLYVCELINDMWVPIGGEVTLDSLTGFGNGSISSIAFAANGNIFANPNTEFGLSAACIYRNGNEFIADQSLITGGFQDNLITGIIDVSFDGNYALVENLDDNFEPEYNCISFTDLGLFERVVPLPEFEFGAISSGGELFCIGSFETNTTSLFTGEGTLIEEYSGVALTASEDLTTCLIFDLTTGEYTITRTDFSGNISQSPPLSSNLDTYGFNIDGNLCVGLFDNGQIDVTTISESGSSLELNSNTFEVEGLTEVTSIGISVDGQNITISNGETSPVVCVYELEVDNSGSNCDDFTAEIVPIQASGNSGPDFNEGTITYSVLAEGFNDPITQYTWDDGSTLDTRTIFYSYMVDEPHSLDGQVVSVSLEDSLGCEVTAELELNFPETQVGQIIEVDTDNSGTFTAISGNGEVISVESVDGTFICTLQNNRWEIVSEAIDGFGSGSFNEDGSVFVLGGNCAYLNDATGTYDIITDVVTTDGDNISNIEDVSSSGEYVIYSMRGGLGGFGRLVGQGEVEELNVLSLGSDEEALSFGQISLDENFYCYTIRNLNGAGFKSELVEINSQETIDVGGRIISASGDLRTCLLQNFDGNNELITEISRWDGGIEFFTEPFENGPYSDYAFNGDGSICVGIAESGLVDYSEVEFTQGSGFSFSTESFTIGLNSFSNNVSISNSGERFTVGTEFPEGEQGIACVYEMMLITSNNCEDDQVPPVALCFDSTVSLEGNGTTRLRIRDVDDGSFDDCTNQLTFLISPPEVTCDDLGVIPVMLTVTDSIGNQATCMSNITVTDPDMVCGSMDCPVLLSTQVLEVATCSNPNSNVIIFTDPDDPDENAIYEIIGPNGNSIPFDILDNGEGFAPVITGPMPAGINTISVLEPDTGCTLEFSVDIAAPVDANGNPCSSGTTEFPCIGEFDPENCGGILNVTLFSICNHTYVYVETALGGRMYDTEDCSLYCDDTFSSSFSCFDTYMANNPGLPFAVLQTVGCNSFLDPDVFEEFPFLGALIDNSTCEDGDRIDVYSDDSYGGMMIALTTGDGTLLFRPNGDLLCADNANVNCLDHFGATSDQIIASWVCGMRLTEPSAPVVSFAGTSTGTPDVFNISNTTTQNDLALGQDESKEDGYSNSIELIELPNAVNDEDLSFNAYPNPSTGMFNLTGNFENSELRLIDVNGYSRTVQLTTNYSGTKSLDLSDYSNGLYFLQIRTLDKVEVITLSLIR